MTDINETTIDKTDEPTTEAPAETAETVESDARPCCAAGPKRGRCPMRKLGKLFAGKCGGKCGKRGACCKSGDGACAEGDECAKSGNNDLVAGITSAAIMTVVIAASCYGQFVLTKWAVKAALKETRLR